MYIVLQQADVRGGSGGGGPIEQLKRLQADEREWEREQKYASLDGDDAGGSAHEEDAKFDEDENEQEEEEDPDGDGIAGTKSVFQFIMFYVFDNDGQRVADVPRAKSQLVAAANRSRFLNDREVRCGQSVVDARKLHRIFPIALSATRRDKNNDKSCCCSIIISIAQVS